MFSSFPCYGCFCQSRIYLFSHLSCFAVSEANSSSDWVGPQVYPNMHFYREYASQTLFYTMSENFHAIVHLNFFGLSSVLGLYYVNRWFNLDFIDYFGFSFLNHRNIQHFKSCWWSTWKCSSFKDLDFPLLFKYIKLLF